MPAHVSEQLRQHQARCAEKARQIRAAHGSVDAYRRTLEVEVITRPDDANIAAFYRLYRSVFTLEEESESIDGFMKVLNFNWDTGVQQDFGPLIEPIFLLRDPSSHEFVAAANFSIYAYPEQRAAFTFDVSCQLHFLLVREDLRGLGIASDLLNRIEAEVTQFGIRHCGAHRSFTTCEQNNPIKMTDEQLIADATAALIDSYDRISWWDRRGFRRLELPYIQPPLSVGAEACRYLDYYVRCPPQEAVSSVLIPTPVLREHLRRFFVVSVGKFMVNMDQNPEWRNLAGFLSERTHVAIVAEKHEESDEQV